jgi:hypothetical protein
VLFVADRKNSSISLFQLLYVAVLIALLAFLAASPD